MREEHGLRLFENRVPRMMFVSKTDDVKMELRRLNKEELHVCSVLLTKYVFG
jgi:hypothetical protein